jgi:hypothetical protein
VGSQRLTAWAMARSFFSILLLMLLARFPHHRKRRLPVCVPPMCASRSYYSCSNTFGGDYGIICWFISVLSRHVWPPSCLYVCVTAPSPSLLGNGSSPSWGIYVFTWVARLAIMGFWLRNCIKYYHIPLFVPSS